METFFRFDGKVRYRSWYRSHSYSLACIDGREGIGGCKIFVHVIPSRVMANKLNSPYGRSHPYLQIKRAFSSRARPRFNVDVADNQIVLRTSQTRPILFREREHDSYFVLLGSVWL